MKTSAILSADGLYRYVLRREWNSSQPPYCAIMLNPSKADAHRNDPTVLRQIKRATQLGYGSLIVLNVGAGRNTKVSDWLAMEDPIGPMNSYWIALTLREVKIKNGIVVAGWGTNAPKKQVDEIIAIARKLDMSIHCLGVTKSGDPVHPLYVAYSKEPERWLRVSRSKNKRSSSNGFSRGRRTLRRVRLL